MTIFLSTGQYSALEMLSFVKYPERMYFQEIEGLVNELKVLENWYKLQVLLHMNLEQYQNS